MPDVTASLQPLIPSSEIAPAAVPRAISAPESPPRNGRTTQRVDDGVAELFTGCRRWYRDQLPVRMLLLPVGEASGHGEFLLVGERCRGRGIARQFAPCLGGDRVRLESSPFGIDHRQKPAGFF